MHQPTTLLSQLATLSSFRTRLRAGEAMLSCKANAKILSAKQCEELTILLTQAHTLASNMTKLLHETNPIAKQLNG